jgi:hydroxyquinol 1,2-dioxygenase
MATDTQARAPTNEPKTGGLVGNPLTETVLASLSAIDNPRLRLLIQAAVAAAHAYARSIDLKPDELLAATEFFTRVGQASDDVRKEFILLSDTTGLTMIVDDHGHQHASGVLESSALGPFYRADSPVTQNGGSIGRPGLDGDPLHVSFQITGADGMPVAGAMLDIWLADHEGLYENQDPAQPEMNLRGRLVGDAEGRVTFWTIKPSCYPIPDDGPVGDLLRLAKRHAWRPAHIHVAVSAPGYVPITSALFLAGDPYIDSDAVFAVKQSLVVTCTPSSLPPPASANDRSVWALDHRLMLAVDRS